MRKVWALVVVVVLGIGLSAVIAGCTKAPSADKMGGDHMGTDKMGGDKMGGDKMGGDKKDKM
jgi:pentapeptide MXKDX repeat protein